MHQALTEELTEKNICPNNSSNLADWRFFPILLLLFLSWSVHRYAAVTKIFHTYNVISLLSAYITGIFISPAESSTLDLGYRGQKLTCATIFAHRKQEYFQFIFFFIVFHIFKAFGWTLKPTHILSISSGSGLLICLMLVFHEDSLAFVCILIP